MAKVTIIGLENYLNYFDDSLFTNLTFPDGINKDLAVNTCLLRSNEFESLYSDPNFLKEQITRRGNQYNPTFAKWVTGFAATYNPIENYDKSEDWTDTTNNKITYGKTETTTYGKTDDTTYGKTVTNEVSAYDQSGYQPESKSTNGGKDTSKLSGKDTLANTGSDTTNGGVKHTGRIHGNIGVTTAPKMLEEYTAFYKDHNIYDLIADIFVTEFCVMVY